MDATTADDHRTDNALLCLAVAGDEAAFVELYRRRHGPLYRFALHMSGSAAVAEEVTQEVFMALIRKPGAFDPQRGPLAGFLYGVARNHVLRCLERERRFVGLEDNPAEAKVMGDLTRSETIGAVRQAVLSLPADYREVVVLCDLQELPYAEAAGVLGVPVGTVRSRLSRGRALLEDKLRARSERCLT
jgi:RNA polymerase sigma-70 factor, ECF subfamily